MVSIEVKSRSKSLKGTTVDVSSSSTVLSLVKTIAKDNKNIDYHRVRLTYKDESDKQVPLNLSSTIADAKLVDKSVVYIKDLGPQISWRTVFIIEYLGPLLIHPLLYWVSGVDNKSTTQVFAFYMVMLHFLKREYETVFVHRFSNDTMPLFNIFKNSSHYWLLSGVSLAVFIYFGSSTPSSFVFNVNELPTSLNYLFLAFWAFAEISNFKTHNILANVRKDDDKKYVIPYGYGFNLVACPNYFFESLAWFAYGMMVGNWSAWVFFFVSTGQMWLWAVKKHKRYIKTFGDDYKKLGRKIFVPYVI